MMTPQEAAIAFREIQESAGPKAEVHVMLSTSKYADDVLHATLYPFGFSGRTELQCNVKANDYETLVERLADAWKEAKGRHTEELVRRMALAIIRITAEQGACTDAALRADKFSDAEVKQYGEGAIAEANRMAANGPFSIQRVAGANAA